MVSLYKGDTMTEVIKLAHIKRTVRGQESNLSLPRRVLIAYAMEFLRICPFESKTGEK